LRKLWTPQLLPAPSPTQERPCLAQPASSWLPSGALLVRRSALMAA
jgi:hypothetical protein